MAFTHFVVTVALAQSPILWAKGGALPRGEISAAPDTKKSSSKAKDEYPCYLDFAHPLGSEAAWEQGGKTFYVLALRSTGTNNDANYAVLKGVLRNEEMSPQAFIKQSSNPLLIGLSDKAFISLSFSKQSELCRMGAASVRGDAHGIKLSEDGLFTLVSQEGTPSMRLGELDKKALIEFDQANLQQKRGISFLKDMRPLWLNKEGDKLVTLVKGKSVRHLTTSPQFKPELKLGEGERILLHQDGIVLSEFNTVKQKIKLTHLSLFPLKREKDSFEIRLPPPYSVATASLMFDPQTGLILVFGTSEMARRSWQALLLFDLKGTLLSELPIPEGYSHGTPAVYNGRAVMMLKSNSSPIISSALIADLKTKKTKIFKLQE